MSDSTDGSPKPAAESSVASLLLTLIQTQKDLTEAIAALADSNYAMAQAMAETSESREDDEDEVPQAMSTKR